MSKIITVRFEVTDETTEADFHEGMCKILHEGWSVNDAADGVHKIDGNTVLDIVIPEQDGTDVEDPHPIETLQEQILELLSKDHHVQAKVAEEVIQRFGSDYDRVSQDGKDEMICLVQISIYKSILAGVL